MKVRVNAKLNLSLNVFPKEGQFHPIDSVVVSVDIFDEVQVTLRHDDQIVIGSCLQIPAQHNTAYLAALAFQQKFHTCGCQIDLNKNIPLGAGLGGSSADAAAVVYCLCNLHGVNVSSQEVWQVCSSVGSDVCCILQGGLVRMTGKGDNIQRLDVQHPLFFAVTFFDKQMSTKDVYAAFDSVGGDLCNNRHLVQCLQHNLPLPCVNGLQRATCSLSNYAQPYLEFCQKHNLSCCMTGSGSAYFVPCQTEAQAYQTEKLLNSHGFVTRVCRSRPLGIEV